MKEEQEKISAIGSGIIEMIKNLITMMLRPMKKMIDMLMDNDEELRTQIADIMTTMNDRMNAIVSTIEVEQSTYIGLKLHDLELQQDEAAEHHRMLKLMVEEVKRSMVEGKVNLSEKIYNLEEVMNEELDVLKEDNESLTNKVDIVDDKIQDIDSMFEDIESKIDGIEDIESKIEDIESNIQETLSKLGLIGDILTE